jgi:hypothetical protein
VRADGFDMLRMPAGVDAAQIAVFEEQGDRPHPFDPFAVQFTIFANSVEKNAMLGMVFRAMLPKILVGVSRISIEPTDATVLMVSHDDLARTFIDHPARGLEGVKLRWPTVDEISKENDRTVRIGVAEGSVSVLITEFVEKIDECVVVTVNVSDNVILHLKSAF